MSVVCKKCGSDNRGDNTNCYHCGDRLCYSPIGAIAEPTLLACPVCDGQGVTEFNDDQKTYMTHCESCWARTCSSSSKLETISDWNLRECLETEYPRSHLAKVADWTVRMGDEMGRDPVTPFPEKHYFYAGIDLIPAVEGLIEYVTDSDLGGNLLSDLRRLRERLLNEKGVTR